MRRIGFHNREKELKEIKDLLDAEPSLITFVYGPILHKPQNKIVSELCSALCGTELVDALKHFAEREEIDTGEVDKIPTTFLVKKNVLFVNPVKGDIKLQSRLNLLAIREVMKDA